MSELRLFDPDIDRGMEPGMEPDMEPDIDLAPTLAIQPDTHMKPRIETPATDPLVNAVSTDPPFAVRVVRSNRRRRTVSAVMDDGVLRISIPNWMSTTEEADSVTEMVRRFTKKLATRSVDLAARARSLAAAHDLRTPSNIEWSDALSAVWGLCTPATSHIRLSTRLVGFPTWVLDYVIVHELAHLHVHGHNADFWKLVQRYPLTERARGFLIAKSGESPEDSC